MRIASTRQAQLSRTSHFSMRDQPRSPHHPLVRHRSRPARAGGRRNRRIRRLSRISSLSSHFLAISRTRISCHAALEKTACAPFCKEKGLRFTEATKFHRKSGVELPPRHHLGFSLGRQRWPPPELLRLMRLTRTLRREKADTLGVLRHLPPACFLSPKQRLIWPGPGIATIIFSFPVVFCLSFPIS
jgi:hypothetical protein